MLLTVIAAASKRLNPSIGRIPRLTRRWSCSIMLFRYAQEGGPTRRGSVCADFVSAIARCDAVHASSAMTRGIPLYAIALLKKRLAAATSRFSFTVR